MPRFSSDDYLDDIVDDDETLSHKVLGISDRRFSAVVSGYGPGSAWLRFQYNLEPLLALMTDEEHSRWNDEYADWPNEAGAAAILAVVHEVINEAIAADDKQLDEAEDLELDTEFEEFCIKAFLGYYQGETIGAWSARVVQPVARALLELADQPQKWLDRMRAGVSQ